MVASCQVPPHLTLPEGEERMQQYGRYRVDRKTRQVPLLLVEGSSNLCGW